jgi:hypothetical protein
VAYSPWGAGEATVTQITLVDGVTVPQSVVMVRVAGGVDGRLYTFWIDVTTTDGLVFSYVAVLKIDASHGSTPWIAPPNITRSTPVTWGAELMGRDGALLTGADGDELSYV